MLLLIQTLICSLHKEYRLPEELWPSYCKLMYSTAKATMNEITIILARAYGLKTSRHIANYNLCLQVATVLQCKNIPPHYFVPLDICVKCALATSTRCYNIIFTSALFL